MGYAWNFGDMAVDDTSGSMTSHVFSAPGGQLVELVVTDDSGCVSTNALDLVVNAATIPGVTVTNVTDTICPGQTVELSATPLPTPWNGEAATYYASPLEIPDGVGIPVVTTIDVEYFPPGATLTSDTDLFSICVDMEHSYMGDLVLQVVCPNGQTTMLHQQGGANIYLGAAIAADEQVPVYGTCWQYCWSATATNGTWLDNISTGTVLAGDPPHATFAPGTYEPDGSFSDLIGCPLNGTWNFEVADLWFLDNGFVCGWSIAFDPSLGITPAAFTPTIGGGCDSSFWSGPAITWTSPDCDSIMASPTGPGAFNYTYTMVDNFGCVNDTVVTITVLPADAPECLSTGVAETSPLEVAISPVPAADVLFISADRTIQGYELWDPSGRLVRRKELSEGAFNTAIQVGDLSSGIYVVVVRTSGGEFRRQVVKQ